MSPPLIISSDKIFILSVISPEGSPSEMRSPSMCVIVPGSLISQAGYTTHPIARFAPIEFQILPSGSTECRCLSSKSVFVLALKKYHHGNPFTADTTAVLGPNNGLISSVI